MFKYLVILIVVPVVFFSQPNDLKRKRLNGNVKMTTTLTYDSLKLASGQYIPIDSTNFKFKTTHHYSKDGLIDSVITVYRSGPFSEFIMKKKYSANSFTTVGHWQYGTTKDSSYLMEIGEYIWVTPESIYETINYPLENRKDESKALYDKKGQLISAYTTIKINDSLVFSSSCKYKYDKGGKLKEYNCSENENKKLAKKKFIYQKLDNHFNALEAVIEEKGKLTLDIRTIEYY